MSTVEQVITKPDTVEEAVSFGVAFLDEHLPGWADSIDVPTLIIGDSGYCVLGQIYGDYDKACEALGLYEETPVRLGFDVEEYAPWHPLQVEWERVITERQS